MQSPARSNYLLDIVENGPIDGRWSPLQPYINTSQIALFRLVNTSPRPQDFAKRPTPAIFDAVFAHFMMTSLLPFEKHHQDQAAALWRALHPDWSWLADTEAIAKS